MSRNVVVVESPAKSSTLKKYLGSDYQILASYGHVRDLVPKTGAVDPAHDFRMQYQLIERNAKHVDAICAALKRADTLYLATDPDREGEAISWHLYELIKEKGLLKNKTVHRITFNEITKQAVLQAVAHPRTLSSPLIDAQQARRALDYLVGFNLSPLLWKKIRRGLSAGRVQSPALRMIVEREEAIEAFKPQEYWTITAELVAEQKRLKARCIGFAGEKVEQFTFQSAAAAEAAKAAILGAAQGELWVEQVKPSERNRHPAPPFTTSTLQQEAARKLGFTAQKTMRVAQQLYEGIEVGDGAVGLITYMRTDSVHLAKEALEALREHIAAQYGHEALPDAPKVYKTRSKNAQEAHEAIRPTLLQYTPESVRSFLSLEQYKLYSLIWKRTIACQMQAALLELLSIDFKTKDGAHRFRVTGSRIKSPGFLQVYEEGKDEGSASTMELVEEGPLPLMKAGDVLPLTGVETLQHFTEPPPRYTEASLVKALEEYGIGRPSTYAAIIATLQQRTYVTLEQKKFKPSDVGRIVNKFLVDYFTQYVDYTFTAKLEDGLDAVARGEQQWRPLLSSFWVPFQALVEDTGNRVQRKDVTQEQLDEACPQCEKPLSIRLGKSGRFIGCTGYPDCDYTRQLAASTAVKSPILLDRSCPRCGKPLAEREGRYGRFIGCTGYPECRFIESGDSKDEATVACPSCKTGQLVKRKSRFGTFFYACNAYPACKYAVNHPPLASNCPLCHWPILMVKTTKRKGNQIVCPQKGCGYEADAPADAGT